jgi:exosortase
MSKTLGEIPKSTWAWIAACGFLFICIPYGIFPYSTGYGHEVTPVISSLWWMWDWGNTPDWEHCVIVPALCIGILYLRREEFAKLKVEPAPLSGGIALALAALAFWLGYKIDILQLSFLIMHFTLLAGVLWLFGWKVIWGCAFPLAFLVFAWPLPAFDDIAFQLRMIMTSLSYGFLDLTGMDVIRQGTAIVSGADPARGLAQGELFQVDIANPCSGIRSLFALIMVTALFAYFTEKLNWKRWTLFACSVPLAIFGNFVRILLLTYGTVLFGSDFAIGSEVDPSFYHMFAGFMVFAAALAGLLMIARFLDWIEELAIINKLQHRFNFTSPDEGGEA